MLKKIDIKNRMCYCFDDIIKFEYFGLDALLIDEKLYEIKGALSVLRQLLAIESPLKMT